MVTVTRLVDELFALYLGVISYTVAAKPTAVDTASQLDIAIRARRVRKDAKGFTSRASY
jgi:hypothetical protein